MHDQGCEQWSIEASFSPSSWPQVMSDDEGERFPARGRRAPISPSADDTRGTGNPSECPGPVELILYVSPHSRHSGPAIENIRSVIKRLSSPRVRLTIHDLSKDPSPGEADGVTSTTTLVERSPGPRTYILGHVTSPDLLISLLEECD